MTHMQKTNVNMVGVRTISDSELVSVTGGTMMDLVNRSFADYLSNCLFKLTREGTTVAVCPVPK